MSTPNPKIRLSVLLAVITAPVMGDEFESNARPLLQRYCFDCHSGDTPNGSVDFETIKTPDDVINHFDVLERAADHLRSETMPPPDEAQPGKQERTMFLKWYSDFIENIESRPAEHKPRRLSVVEYRNTLRSVFGFDLEVAIIEAEQTLAERSMVIKLLPTDPPGASGFKNDTHRNRLSTVAWDQYSYLAERAIKTLFSRDGKKALESIVGTIESNQRLTQNQARTLLRTFLRRTRRRINDDQLTAKTLVKIDGLTGEELETALQFEIRTLLMAPAFLYRGLLTASDRSGRQPVDEFELAERLAYFLWADMPDEQLLQAAEESILSGKAKLGSEVDRMLASPKARSLAEVFAVEWFSLNEIDHVSNNPPKMLALKSQPIDFMDYLFTRNRPVLELIDSDVAFINPHTAKMYGRDAKQLTRGAKQKGIEIAAVANQQINLTQTTSRGGILTMAGVLAMNKGPIQRGTWMLERILGQELPEPPPDVGQVAPNKPNSKLTFRQRFEQHRSKSACAVCHDKIDPLGFVFETYDGLGRFTKQKAGREIDTSARLPTGEEFEDINGLKKILQTTQRRVVIRNIVSKVMSYALCRKLMVYDRPTIESITNRLDESNGTWRDLFVAIAYSVPFRETIVR